MLGAVEAAGVVGRQVGGDGRELGRGSTFGFGFEGVWGLKEVGVEGLELLGGRVILSPDMVGVGPVLVGVGKRDAIGREAVEDLTMVDVIEGLVEVEVVEGLPEVERLPGVDGRDEVTEAELVLCIVVLLLLEKELVA